MRDICSKDSVKSKSKKINVFLIILIFMLIYFSHDTVLFGTNNDSNFFLIANVILVSLLLAFLFYVIVREIKINFKIFTIYVFLVIATLVTMFFSYKTDFKYFYIIVLMTLVFFMTQIFTMDEFLISYLIVILFLSVFSLITFLFSKANMDFIYNFPIIISQSGFKFYYLGFANVLQKLEYLSIRNYGIFREPGVYAVFLNLGLIFAKKIKNEKQMILVLVILVFTIISTFSTGGVLVMGGILLTYFIDARFKNKYYFLIPIFIFLLFFILLNKTIFDITFSKLFSWNSSTFARVGSIFLNLQITTRNLFSALFGSGFDFVESFFIDGLSNGYGIVIHNTNTFFKMMSVFGIPYMIIILYGTTRFILKISNKSKLSKVLTVFLVFLIFSNADLIFNSITYFLVLFGLNTDFE